MWLAVLRGAKVLHVQNGECTWGSSRSALPPHEEQLRLHQEEELFAHALTGTVWGSGLFVCEVFPHSNNNKLHFRLSVQQAMIVFSDSPAFLKKLIHKIYLGSVCDGEVEDW